MLRAPEEFPETQVKAINNRGDIVGMAFNYDKNTTPTCCGRPSASTQPIVIDPPLPDVMVADVDEGFLLNTSGGAYL